MDTVSASDLFFIIGTLAVIIITTLIIVALVYVILFLRTVKAALNTAKKTAEFVTQDVAGLRTNIKERGFVKSLLGFALNLKKKRKGK